MESNAAPLLDAGGKVIGYCGADRDITEQRRAENELRRSESRMRALLDAIPDLMFRCDKDGVILDFSASHQKELFLPPSEFVGKNMRDVMPPPIVRHSMLHITLAIETGTMQIFEYQLEMDGIEKSYEARIVAAGDGEVTAIVRNVTERKQAEDKLRRSEANLSAAQRITHLGSWEVELSDLRRVNNNKVHWSDEVYRIFGYEPGAIQVSISRYFDSIHADDRKYCRRAFIEAVLDRKNLNIEFRVVLPSGSEKILHGQAEVVYDEQSNQPLKFIGTVQNITERKRAEEASEQSERDYRTVFEQAHDAILIFAPEREIVLEVNRRACEIYGFDRSEFIGMSIETISKIPANGKEKVKETQAIGEYLNFETV